MTEAPPTVLHCFDDYLPNSENWAFRLIRHVPRFRQAVAAHRFLDNPFYAPGIDYLRPPVQVGERPRAGLRKLWRLAGAFLGWLYPHYLRRRLRGRRIDVVHSHFGHVGWHYRGLARALGAVHAVSFYGWDYEYLPTLQPRWRSRWQRLFAEADLLVCEGEHGAEVLARQGCPRHKIRVCRLGIEPAKIGYVRRDKAPGELHLLQVASFREKKGHVDTARAFAMAAPRCPGATLTLVGSGSPGIVAEVRRIVAAAGLQARVKFVEQIDFSRLHEFMRDYQVFIHPSIHTPQGDCEGGAPVVLLDAQATGMPVISTLHCDIPGEVADGRTGLLAPERDVAALAAAIERFYRMDQDEYAGFCERARAHVERNFDAIECSARLADAYDDALAARRAGGGPGATGPHRPAATEAST